MSKILPVFVLATLLALLALMGVAQANHENLDICCAWNSEIGDGELTYSISGGDTDDQGAVRAAMVDWNTALGTNLALTELPSDANVDIKFKRGGGMIAGQARRQFDKDGFVRHVNLSISGSAFGNPNLLATITEITAHEGGHAIGLGHANFPNLMDPVVGGVTAISTCDVQGVLAANAWALVDNPIVGPHQPDPANDPLDCGIAAPDHDVTVAGVTASAATATQGDVVRITVTVANHGNNTETFNVTLDESPDGITWTTTTPVTLEPGESTDLGADWDTTGASPVVHTLTATQSPSDGGLPDSAFTTVTIEAGGTEEPNCPPKSKSPKCQ